MANFEGLKFLVIDDEPFVLMALCDSVRELGGRVAFRARTLRRGLDLALNRTFDVAILDVKLGDALSFPIANVLNEREIPCVFVTGYSYEIDLHVRFQEAVVEKPFQIEELRRALDVALSRADRRRSPDAMAKFWDVLSFRNT